MASDSQARPAGRGGPRSNAAEVGRAVDQQVDGRMGAGQIVSTRRRRARSRSSGRRARPRSAAARAERRTRSGSSAFGRTMTGGRSSAARARSASCQGVSGGFSRRIQCRPRSRTPSAPPRFADSAGRGLVGRGARRPRDRRSTASAGSRRQLGEHPPARGGNVEQAAEGVHRGPGTPPRGPPRQAPRSDLAGREHHAHVAIDDAARAPTRRPRCRT